MHKFKSLMMAIRHYFMQEPNSFTPSPQEMIAFKNSLSDDERVAAEKEMRDLGYEFE